MEGPCCVSPMCVQAPVRYAKQFESLGLGSPPGVLLAGPPGCGKTLLAKVGQCKLLWCTVCAFAVLLWCWCEHWAQQSWSHRMMSPITCIGLHCSGQCHWGHCVPFEYPNDHQSALPSVLLLCGCMVSHYSLGTPFNGVVGGQNKTKHLWGDKEQLQCL